MPIKTKPSFQSKVRVMDHIVSNRIKFSSMPYTDVLKAINRSVEITDSNNKKIKMEYPTMIALCNTDYSGYSPLLKRKVSIVGVKKNTGSTMLEARVSMLQNQNKNLAKVLEWVVAMIDEGFDSPPTEVKNIMETVKQW